MKIMANGLTYAGNLLIDPVDEDVFAKALADSLERNGESVKDLTHTTTRTSSFRGEVERISLDPGDPKDAGWTYLITASDPRGDEFKNILNQLAVHRGMIEPDKPLIYDCEPNNEDWFDWLNENYFGLVLEGKKVPQYILIAGGPEQIPFHFHSILDSVAKVGRVDFDSLDDLENYVKKLIRIETADEPAVMRESVLFATDGGIQDPTYFSRKYMVEPLEKYINDDLSCETYSIIGDKATKTNLLDALSKRKPAFVYTASHGLGATDKSYEVQKKYNGAICCQRVGHDFLASLVTAEDIPADEPFLEGSVFFQFACFGYGTPAESEFEHWYSGTPQKYTDKDFVAALPKKLLANPRGPIAFIGHFDTAWLHGFDDPNAPHILERWDSRMAPFVQAANKILKVQPAGLAMDDMNKRYDICNAIITNTYDRMRRGKLKWTADLEQKFLDNWITRSDAQDYMIFGDPAAKLRIPSDQ